MTETSDVEIAAMVCPHVLENPECARFICKTQDGLVAACAPDCGALESGEGLGLMGIKHVEHALMLPFPPSMVPINTQMIRLADAWSMDYFEDDSQPMEGDFYLAPEAHESRHWQVDKILFAYRSGRDLVSLTLDEGAQILPVWGGAVPKDFSTLMKNGERLVEVEFSDVLQEARRRNILFLGVNFLCEAHDFGLLTCPGEELFESNVLK